jgi:dipeptidyl aminopeptidase/acylaminoacyl peptidase
MGQFHFDPKGTTPMLNRSIRIALTALIAFAALALPTAAAAAGPAGAIVFSRVDLNQGNWEDAEGKPVVEEPHGGLYAARNGRLNQLTENPADSQPDFSADGRMIAFVRDGDIYAMRADGTGQHALTSGVDVDGHPHFAPNGRYLLFERRGPAEGSPRDLYTIHVGGDGLHSLTSTPEDEHEASFSPTGRAIVFVRSVAEVGGCVADDLYSVRPSGAGLARLTRTDRLDEFSPRFFRGGIVFSRGQSGDGPGAYADVFTMRSDGRRPRALIRGAGSAFVEDVTPNGRLLLFRRDQGLWVKRLGRGRARKLSDVADGSKTNAVFSSDGRRVAAFVATEETATLSAIDVVSRRQIELAQGFSFESGSATTTIGPVIAWQPVR